VHYADDYISSHALYIGVKTNKKNMYAMTASNTAVTIQPKTDSRRDFQRQQWIEKLLSMKVDPTE